MKMGDIEVWRPVTGYKDFYEVSSKGRVKSLGRYQQNHSKLQWRPETILKPGLGTDQYLHVGLSKKGIVSQKLVHRLVAQAFIVNPLNLKCVNHIDQDKLNNNINNIEWCTYEYNNNFADKVDRIKRTEGKQVIAKNLKTGKTKKFFSYNEAEKKLGIWSGSVSYVVNKKQKSVSGYTFIADV